MKKHISLLTVTAASLMMTAGLVSAASITLLQPNDAPPSWNVKNVEQWATTGNLMDGIKITAKFSNQEEDIKYWEDEKGAVGTSWSLTMQDYSKNTWDIGAWWILSNISGSPITSLVIDGKPGNTVFDIIYNSNYSVDLNENSLGSKNGRSVEANAEISPVLMLTAQYGTQVLVNNVFKKDLYQTLTFNFEGGLLSGYSFWFATDTDSVNPVPEPATMLLFGIGAMGIAAFRKRKDS